MLMMFCFLNRAREGQFPFTLPTTPRLTVSKTQACRWLVPGSSSPENTFLRRSEASQIPLWCLHSQPRALRKDRAPRSHSIIFYHRGDNSRKTQQHHHQNESHNLLNFTTKLGHSIQLGYKPAPTVSSLPFLKQIPPKPAKY